jgi:hypothetical protein
VQQFDFGLVINGDPWKFTKKAVEEFDVSLTVHHSINWFLLPT